MSNLGFGRSGNAYWIRVRSREQTTIQIHGGTQRGGGTRRVSHWTKWKSHRAADTAWQAIEQFEAVKRLNPLAEVGVFLAGKRVTIEQLHFRAKEDRARREHEAEIEAEPCNACQVRMRAGLEGECPACANERTRNERRRETPCNPCSKRNKP